MLQYLGYLNLFLVCFLYVELFSHLIFKFYLAGDLFLLASSF